jgi:16S rRNA (cytosine967-C5)-methyltransferase
MAEGEGGGLAASRARRLALDVLLRVEDGAYAQPVLDRRLRRPGLSPQDRALATDLTYGCLRWQLELDWVLGAYLTRPLSHLPAPVRGALRLGVYQILHLDRVPPYAAVHESVALIREKGYGGLGGLANAVLRRVVREGRPPLPPDPVSSLALRFAHPTWLVERWLRRYGEEKTKALLSYDNAPAPLTVRVGRGACRDQLAREMTRQGCVVRPTMHSPRGLVVEQSRGVEALPGFSSGQLTVQDEAAMLVEDLLAPALGEWVVDALCGRGTKTWALWERVAPGGGGVVAVDHLAPKLAALSREAARRGIPLGTLDRPQPGHLHPVHGDARHLAALLEPVAGKVRRILLDAPCTALGVMRRRPEVRLRRRPEDSAALHPLQVQLLEAALEAVAPGGEVLYVTCTTEEEENEEVVREVLYRRAGQVELQDLGPRLPPTLSPYRQADGSVRLFGPRTGTDSFFYALFLRRR